jgi:DNA helicase-2/ATP-dependent DNA helicase PcrA
VRTAKEETMGLPGVELPVWERGKNEEQLEVVRHREGPLRVLAAAGSGKTEALVARVACLIDAGVDPQRILGVTFSKKGASEMDARLRKYGVAGCSIQTWHSFCYRVIREQPTREASWQVDDNKAKTYVKQALGYKHENWSGADATKVRNFIGRCKANWWAPDNAAVLPFARSIFRNDGARAQRVYAISEALIETAGLLPFDNMLCIVANLFAEDEEARREWASRYDYVLTDEVQDNSPVQEALQEFLARDHRNLMVVGDMCQSLFSFRGSDPSLLDGFAEKWSAKSITMHRNYRSGRAIVAAANAVIRDGKYKLPVDMVAERKLEGQIAIVACETQEDEAREIVTETKRQLADGKRLSDIMVLVRLNAQTRALEDELLREKIPYVVMGGVSFYERKEVKDLLAYLRVAIGRDESGDGIKRCINAPFRFLGAKFVECVQDEKQSDPEASWSDCVTRASERAGIQRRQVQSAAEWVRMIESVRAGIYPGPERKAPRANDVLEDLVRRTGYLQWLEKEEGEESVESSHAANVREMIRVAREFATVGELLDYVDQTVREATTQKRRRQGDVLTVMSCHKSKGGESPVVWVMGCNEDVLPHAKGDIEEERRIMYVAVTRARDRLILSYVKRMATRIGVKELAPSRFLDAIVGEKAETTPPAEPGFRGEEDVLHDGVRMASVFGDFPCGACGLPFLRCPGHADHVRDGAAVGDEEMQRHADQEAGG